MRQPPPGVGLAGGAVSSFSRPEYRLQFKAVTVCADVITFGEVDARKKALNIAATRTPPPTPSRAITHSLVHDVLGRGTLGSRGVVKTARGARRN